MQAFIEAAIDANQEIAALLRRNEDDSLFYPDGRIGYGGDRSLKIDLIAEEIFIKRLGGFGRINSEECGPIGDGKDEIIIDPIDGSANIASGFPYYGASVALKSGVKAVASIVCNLANGDYFVKLRDETYRSNLYDPKKLPLERALKPQAGFFEKAYSHPKLAKALNKNGFKFRSPGALALSLAYAHGASFVAAAGAPREYDIIAGLHLCEDLHIFRNEKLILVSADQAVFERLKSVFIEGEL
ncbi:MAG: inositol monophosphatase [Helicobacteraceae bacterium]|jgi:myo-inositol-1(or 4)-monophosphatase|nr:inositol monophosphatase [Helicobacteraceae bacterium]